MPKIHGIFLIFILFAQLNGDAQSDKLFFDLTSGGGRLFPTLKMKDLAGPVTFFNAKLGFENVGKKGVATYLQLPGNRNRKRLDFFDSYGMPELTCFIMKETFAKLKMIINSKTFWQQVCSGGMN